MINSYDQIQLLYEIALNIGEGSNMKQAANKALSTYLRKLNCFAGAIYKAENIKDKCWFKNITSIPVKIERNTFFNEIISHFNTSPNNCINDQIQVSLPFTKTCEEKTTAYVMKLADFGLLVMLKKDNKLPEDLIYALQPLNKKLGEALISFQIKEINHIHSQALEASNNAILITDAKGNIEWVNKAWCVLNGYENHEAIGLYTNLIKSESNDEKIFKSMWDSLSRGEVWHGNLMNKRKDKTEYNAEITITPLVEEFGLINHYISISQDITSRKQDEDALLESKTRFEEMANLLPQPIWEIDLEGKLIYANKAGFQIFGYEPHEVASGLNFLKVIGSNDRHRIKEVFQRKMEGSKSGDYEYNCLKKNGETFPAMIFSAPIYKKGNIEGIRGIVLDVTTLKNTQERLERISSLQDILIKISTQYINISFENIEYAINNALEEIGNFVDADRAYIFDYDFDKEITNNTFEWCHDGIEPQKDLLQDVPLSALSTWVESHLKGESIHIPDVSNLPIDSEVRAILESQDIKSLIALPMYNEQKCIGFMGLDSVRFIRKYTQKEQSILEVFAQIVVNLKNRLQAEMQLKIAKEKAEKAEKFQFNFLSTMSHEIRTPLNAVVGLTNILLMETPKPEQMENLNTLKFSAQNLLSIINDILDYNKLISGNVILNNHDFSINEIINGMYRVMSNLALSKEIDLEYFVSEDVPQIIIGDSTRLLQIINNLVSNAIKFTAKGYVKVSISKTGFKNGKHIIEFKVEDSGIGVPSDKFTVIFEDFKQSSSSTTREYGGTGLGLPIVKKLLQVMDSDIKIESEVGKGTIFSFEIAFEDGDPLKIKTYDQVVKFDNSLEGIKVLLVEDNKINQVVALKFLHEWKCIVEIANNGLIALEMIEVGNYDVVLMDLQMPVMDGYTATRAIRENKNNKIKNIAIIALSASALGEIKTKARNFGMNDFITKPFNPPDLFKALIKQTIVRKEQMKDFKNDISKNL
jgi:PAS domain S-box-containing protein